MMFEDGRVSVLLAHGELMAGLKKETFDQYLSYSLMGNLWQG